MSGIDLLFSTAIDFERTHQLAIYALLKESNFSLFPKLDSIRERKIIWEPENQLFDLGIETLNYKIFIELKMWSPLTEKQIEKQKEFLKKENHKAVYILLGTAGIEYTKGSIINITDKTGIKVGYNDLLEALNNLIILPDQSSDVYELALSYRNNISIQYQKILNAYKSNKKGQLFYYSLYSKIKQNIKNIETDIYTFNKGGPVYNLCNQDSWNKDPLIINGIKTKVYYEISNDKLCIKLHCLDIKNDGKKESIRKIIRNAIHHVLDNKYKILDKGRIGTYMTACQIDYDFSNINSIDKSTDIFRDINDKMPMIYTRINEFQK